MELNLKNIYTKENELICEIEYSSDIAKYFNNKSVLKYIYPLSLSRVPKSILLIPILCNFLPMAFVLNVDIIVDEIDKIFFESIDEIRAGYQNMIPMYNLLGRVIPNKCVINHYNTEKVALLFSNGIDAMSSLINNVDEINDLITIWGSDIKFDNETGWKKMYADCLYNASLFSKNSLMIRSNFRDILNEEELYYAIKKTNDGWWHAFQHGIALIGQVAPLSFLNGYKKVLIASSFTKEYQPICASDPRIDNKIKYGDTITVHDGFEYDRSDKVKIIGDYLLSNKLKLTLHVCWSSSSGLNCGHCEKCLRTYLNCRSVNVDSSMLGVVPTISMRKIKNIYLKKTIYDEGHLNRMSVVKKHIETTFGTHYPKDLAWIVKTDFTKVNDSVKWKIYFFLRNVKHLIFK